MSQLSHFDEKGQPRMVDVGEKQVTRRVAVASAQVKMLPETMNLIRERKTRKGDVLEIARIAGVMGGKKTSDLIPLCHPIHLDSIAIDFQILNTTTIKISATACATDRTGVEMEAMTAASVAGLVIYDMCKSADRSMVITHVRLEEKSGGKSGHYQRDAPPKAVS